MWEFVIEIAADLGLHLLFDRWGARENSWTECLMAGGLVLAMLGGLFGMLWWIDYCM